VNYHRYPPRSPQIGEGLRGKIQIDEKIVGGAPTEPLGVNDKILFDSRRFGQKVDRINLVHGELTITRPVIVDGAGVVTVGGVPTPGPDDALHAAAAGAP
jgi:hypothetical protein